MKKITLLLFLIPLIGISQIKIDSLGIHITDGYHLIEVPNKSSKEIYSKMSEYLTKNNDSVIDKKESEYLKFQVTNNYISYLRRTGKDGHIGHKSIIEMDFKDGKCRIKSIDSEFYLIFGHISDQPKFVKEKKKKAFLIFGKGVSLYDSDMILRKAGRMAKPKMEAYFNGLITDITTHLNHKDDW